MPLHCAAAAYVQDRNTIEASRHNLSCINLVLFNDFLLKQMGKDFKNESFKERTKQMALQM